MSFAPALKNTILGLIARIYDAALDAKLWPGVVAEVARLQGSSKALLLTSLHSPRQGGFSFPVGISESVMQQWGERYVEHDLWSRSIVEHGLFHEGKIVTDADVLPHAELLRSLWYREFLSKTDIARFCTGIVFGTESREVLPTVLSIYRGVKAEPFGESERMVHGLLVPHVSRAVGITYRLRDASFKTAATLAALERLSTGVILLDEFGHVVHANRRARRAFEMGDGLCLRKRGPAAATGSLSADNHRVAGEIEAAVASCLQSSALEVPHFSTSVAVPRSSGARPYALNFAPLPAGNEFRIEGNAASAIVFVADPEDPAMIDPEVLRNLYALTAAEIELALRLGAGDTVALSAQNLGLKESTIRTQLQSIFQKTGTRRQAELVKLLASLGAVDAD